MFQEIKASLQQLYLEDKRPWLTGFSGGKDSIRQPTDWRRPFLMFSYPFLPNSEKSPSPPAPNRLTGCRFCM